MTTKIHFRISRWSYWTPKSPGSVAEVPEIPLMLRRRASASGKSALRVAFDCVPGSSPTPTVFCSRHGEVHRSVEMLTQLARGEPLSPTTFSLSVHNSAAAVFSIARGDVSPTSALSAEQDTLPEGLIEAALCLDEGYPQVLLVAHDDVLPDLFKWGEAGRDSAHALGLLLTRSEGEPYSLELSQTTEALSREEQIPQVAAFLATAERELSIASTPRRWTWRRDA